MTRSRRLNESAARVEGEAVSKRPWDLFHLSNVPLGVISKVKPNPASRCGATLRPTCLPPSPSTVNVRWISGWRQWLLGKCTDTMFLFIFPPPGAPHLINKVIKLEVGGEGGAFAAAAAAPDVFFMPCLIRLHPCHRHQCIGTPQIAFQ